MEVSTILFTVMWVSFMAFEVYICVQLARKGWRRFNKWRLKQKALAELK